MMNYQFKNVYHYLSDVHCVTDVFTTDDQTICLLNVAEQPMPSGKTFQVRYDWTQGIFLEKLDVLLAGVPVDSQKRFQNVVKKLRDVLDLFLDNGQPHYHICRGCGRNSNCTKSHPNDILVLEDSWVENQPAPLVCGAEDICGRCLEREQLTEFKKTVMDLAKPVLDMREKWRKDFPEKEIPHAVSHVETELGRKIAEMIEATK